MIQFIQRSMTAAADAFAFLCAAGLAMIFLAQQVAELVR